MEAIEKHIDQLECQVFDLSDENENLRRELALSSPRDVAELITSVNAYLDWIDAPNRTMDDGGVRLVRAQLRGALDEALRELR